MTYVNPEKIALDQEMASRQLDKSPITILEKIKHEGRVWTDLCSQYGVTNPVPPWKITLEATCDVLAEENCALPALERRWEEDELCHDHYRDLPYPENQLLALAHSMIRRGIFNEQELAKHMAEVEKRLNMV